MIGTVLATIGIMSAMPQEAELIRNEIKQQTVVQIGKRSFIQGTFEGIPVVFCLSGVGKVSAGATTALLIEKFHVDEIVFTGVAGGGPEVEIGDIVVGHAYLQHDLDLRPIASQFYIYTLGKQTLYADEERVYQMMAAANRFLSTKEPSALPNLSQPKVLKGIILSGDQFISSLQQQQEISKCTKEVLETDFHAIEMEGAAVAQVCEELEVPFIVVRTISDKADHKAGIDFSVFMEQVASIYSLGILKEYFQNLPVGSKK